MVTVIIGAGYTGTALGNQLVKKGESVVGTRTEEDDSESFPILKYDLGNEGQWAEVLSGVSDESIRCVFTAGPPRMTSRATSLRKYESFLERLPKNRVKNFLFLSSTSVYGDARGKWVTETTVPDPISSSGSLKVEAEKRTSDRLEPEVPVIHARIGGIYGPGRNPARRYLSDEYRLIENHRKHSNRIYKNDLVNALDILTRKNQSIVINITDRKPVLLREIVEFLYRETGRDPEEIKTITWEQAEKEYSEMRLGLLKPRKKVSSRKLRDELGFEYQFPTVYDGLRSLPPLSEE